MRLLSVNLLAVVALAAGFLLGDKTMLANADQHQTVHVVLSIISFSVLAVAGGQSLFLAVVEHRVRTNPQSSLLQKMPPIESIEVMLFRLIAIGFVLLSALLTSSVIFYHAVLWQQFLGKTLIAMSAWLVFAILLLGRVVLGWRGKKAIYCTLSGVILLLMAYIFGRILVAIIGY